MITDPCLLGLKHLPPLGSVRKLRRHFAEGDAETFDGNVSRPSLRISLSPLMQNPGHIFSPFRLSTISVLQGQ